MLPPELTGHAQELWKSLGLLEAEWRLANSSTQSLLNSISGGLIMDTPVLDLTPLDKPFELSSTRKRQCFKVFCLIMN